MLSVRNELQELVSQMQSSMQAFVVKTQEETKKTVLSMLHQQSEEQRAALRKIQAFDGSPESATSSRLSDSHAVGYSAETDIPYYHPAVVKNVYDAVRVFGAWLPPGKELDKMDFVEYLMRRFAGSLPDAKSLIPRKYWHVYFGEDGVEEPLDNDFQSLFSNLWDAALTRKIMYNAQTFTFAGVAGEGRRA